MEKSLPFLKKPNIELPYDPEVPLPNRYKNVYHAESKLQGYIVKDREISQYFIITINEV